ncbi:hypothetical protein PYCC9005_004703 [Savitreella phatthalungensis]
MGTSLKRKSKRQPVRQRHKVAKKVAEHNRKSKKAAKNDPTWKSRVKKDIGIPSSFPYKSRLLGQIVERKRADVEARRGSKNSAPAENEELNVDEDLDDEMEAYDQGEASDDQGDDSDSATGPVSIADFAASIAERSARYRQEKQSAVDDANGDDTNEGDLMNDHESGHESDASHDPDEWAGFDESHSSALKKETSRKMFDKDFKNVVEKSDVVLFVLDARDPEGTRSREVEKLVLGAAGGDKRLLLVINKVDLVPSDVVRDWTTHLGQSFPTIPIRASRAPAAGAPRDAMHATAAGLLKSIKAYASKSSLRRAITVGVVGYPNVGKSSIINALLSAAKHSRTEPCPTGAEAGVTRSIKELKLDSKVKLVDSPGIVFPGASSADIARMAQLVLLNAIPSQQIIDPLPAVTSILALAASNDEIMQGIISLYDLPALVPNSSSNFTAPDPHDFLIHVARKRGRIRRGGIPDVESAARAILSDWRDGRLRWYQPAPRNVTDVAAGATSNGAGEGSTSMHNSQPDIVYAWAQEFDLDGLLSSVDMRDV